MVCLENNYNSSTTKITIVTSGVTVVTIHSYPLLLHIVGVNAKHK